MFLDVDYIKKRAHIFFHKKTRKSKVLASVCDGSFNNAKVVDYRLDYADFNKYVVSSKYFERYPKYIVEFGEPRQPKGVLERKFAEHYLSLVLGGWEYLDEYSVIVDVAASNSPFKDILLNSGYGNVYRTDLNYVTNVEAHDIGCAADNMSFFLDGSVDLIVSHNSVEHFEGNSDIGFIRECSRILKKGGKMVLIPLVLTEKGVNHTDLSVWATKYRNAPNFPIFDSRFPIQFGEHKQRLMKFYSPSVLDFELGRFNDMDFTIVRIDSDGRGNDFALVGQKK